MRTTTVEEAIMVEIANIDPKVRKDHNEATNVTRYFRGGIEITIPQLFGYRNNLESWDGVIEYLVRLDYVVERSKKKVKITAPDGSVREAVGTNYCEGLFKIVSDLHTPLQHSEIIKLDPYNRIYDQIREEQRDGKRNRV